MPIRRALFAAALASVVFPLACDLNKTGAQLTAQHVMVATLLHTPQVEIRPEAIAGFDASFPANDSGFTFDGGFFIDAGLIVAPVTVAFAFFGTRNGEGLSQTAPTPVAGATMSVAVGSGSPLTMDGGLGTFQLTSLENSALTYQDNGKYTFTAKASGETFLASVEAVPAREEIPQFHPMGKSFIDQAADAGFEFRRPDLANGVDRNLGFVLVIPVSRDGKQGDLSYTNLPKDAVDYLKLVVAPGQWKTTTVTIPGSAFPERDKNYIILLQSAKLGQPDSDNLFYASAIIAGTADVGIVKTH